MNFKRWQQFNILDSMRCFHAECAASGSPGKLWGQRGHACSRAFAGAVGVPGLCGPLWSLPSSPRHYDIRRNDDIINFFNDFSDHLAEEAPVGTLSENQAQEHREEEDRQRREDRGAAAAGEERAPGRRRAAPRLEGLGPVRRWQPGRRRAAPRLEGLGPRAAVAARAGSCRARQASGALRAGSILHSSRTPPWRSHRQLSRPSRDPAVWVWLGFSPFTPSSALPVSLPQARELQSTRSAD